MVVMQPSLKVLILLILMVFTQIAQASLLIAPLRVVFDERERGKSVTVINTGQSTATYRIDVINLKQLENGKHQDLSKLEALPDGYYAKDMIRFSPRQVTLRPGARQKVRLSVRKPVNLSPGEYRSHLKFTQLPSPEMLENNPDRVGIKLYMLSGFSIPVHVRQGVVKLQAKITKARIEKNPVNGWQLNTTIVRQGDFSSFGKLTLYWRNSPNANYEEVRFLNNVALYRETAKRVVAINLPKELVRRGEYKVVYQKDKEFSQKVFSEYQFTY